MQADISMSDMLDTIKDAKAVAALATSYSDTVQNKIDALPARLQTIIDFIEQQEASFYDKACVRYAGFDTMGLRMGMGVRSSDDPNRDIHLMTSFLEFNDAFRLRNVPVRFKLGSLWLTSEVPPDEKAQTKHADALLHAAVLSAINLAESQSKVLRVFSRSNPFEHRMGGHYMTYELRDNLAAARAKAAQPCKIVRASNYDNELFTERFWNDGEVLTRDAAQVKVKELNDDPERNHHIYWKVVDEDYKLYEFEP